MPTTIHNFNHLYVNLLKLNKIEDASSYVSKFEKHKHLLSKEENAEIFRKVLVLKSIYIQKLFKQKNYSKIRIEIDSVLEDFMLIPELEKKQTNLYKEILETSAKVHFYEGNFEIAKKEFEILNEQFSFKSSPYAEYLLSIDKIAQKRIIKTLIFTALVSLLITVLFTLLQFEDYIFYPLMISLLSSFSLLVIKGRNMMKKQSLYKKTPSN